MDKIKSWQILPPLSRDTTTKLFAKFLWRLAYQATTSAWKVEEDRLLSRQVYCITLELCQPFLTIINDVQELLGAAQLQGVGN